MIKFVSVFWQVGGFLWILLYFSFTNNTDDHHDITEIHPEQNLIYRSAFIESSSGGDIVVVIVW